MDAKWIGYLSDNKALNIEKKSISGACAQYYRTVFSLSKKPISAQLEITSLGIFKAYINGKEVGEEFFAPGWTDYGKRIFLRKYDVLPLLATNNAIAVCVGDGWYAGYISIVGRKVYGDYPLCLYAKLSVVYEDGSVEEIISNENWKAGLGAIRENDFLFGEIFDSRLPHLDISTVSFDDSKWDNVRIQKDKTHLLDYQDYEPVVVKKKLKAQLVSQNGNVSIYNFNQNFAGFIRIKGYGNSGDTITVRHGEMLNKDGSLFTDNLRLAKATDVFVCNGKEFDYNPTMTYHGFQYVEITCTGNAKVEFLEGLAIHNDVKRTGKIETSNKLFNKLNSNIEWGMRSNFIDLPTDCPQRNERLGWSGDTQVFSRSAMYIADCSKFYKTHLVRINDSRQGGLIPDIVPYFGLMRLDSVAWRDVAIILPYNLWDIYGDTEAIKNNLPMIKDFIELQKSTSVNYLWDRCIFGDWLNVDQPCHKTVLATLCNILCFNLAIKMYKAIGEPYESLQEFVDKVITRFKVEFISKDGEILQGNQTVYAMAYVNKLISREQANKHLKESFAKVNDHIHSGFVGIRFILPVLCDVGLCDLAYKLICNTSFPSWGYSIANGATTIWEHWDSYTIENGFKDPIMNSFNHYSLGSCVEWFYEYVLGIKPIEAGFKKVKIQPFVDKTGKVNSVNGEFNSVNGKIQVQWEKVDKGYVCNIEKPHALDAEFVFDNITKIICDGKEVEEFINNAKNITVYFN